MREHYEFANFLVASWRLAQPGQKLPTSHGVLDRALEKVGNELPERFHGALSFGDAAIGRLCHEVPDILRAAQESFRTSDPNPTYTTAELKFSSAVAMDILDNLDIDIDDGKKFGKRLAALISDELKKRETVT